MRSGASRLGLALLALCLLAALCGCCSTTKKHYLKHLTTVIAPVTPATGTGAAADEPSPAIAAANPGESSR